MEVSGLSSPTIFSNSASDSSADFARPLAAPRGQSNKPIVLPAKFLDRFFGTPEELRQRLVAVSHYAVRACDLARKSGHVIFDAELDELVGRLAKAYVRLCEAGDLPMEVSEEVDQTTWLCFLQLVGCYEHGAPEPAWLNSVMIWLLWAPYMTAQQDGLRLELPVRLDANRVMARRTTDARAEGDKQP